MQTVSCQNKKENFPKLTIAFPIWILYDTPGENACYHDVDRIVREHKERGFNCIRCDSGAGLMHDRFGNPRGEVELTYPFTGYGDKLRQFNVTGEGGKCDLLPRLIALAEAALRHGVKLILSSWYYLHTFWFQPVGDPLCQEHFDVPKTDRVTLFGEYLHYILCELESRGLDGCIAFAEIFNEANGEELVDYTNEETKQKTLENHEAALARLQAAHPQILFAYDVTTPMSPDTVPANMQVLNFHSYFLWDIYDIVADAHPEFFGDEITLEEVVASRAGRHPADPGWYDRIAKYENLLPQALPAFAAALEEQLKKDFDRYCAQCDEVLDLLPAMTAKAPDVPIVCGEGVTYIASKALLWEENSDLYWRLIERTLKEYKSRGIRGTVIRTCMGPEDPAWTLCPDRILHYCNLFLAD